MRTCRTLAVFGFIVLHGEALIAQEPPTEKPRNDSGRYFRRPVDLWESGLAVNRVPPPPGTEESPPSRVTIRENIWAQPIRTPDGSWMIYVPPKQVLDFLESPSEDTAKAYLGWKRDQAEKLRKAMVLLSRIKESASPATDGGASPDPIKAAAVPQDFLFRMTYFKKPFCPHCVSQDAVLSGWLKSRPLGKLEVVQPGEREELWKAYDIRGTPTLVLEGGTPPRKLLLIGLQTEAALEAALGQLSTGSGDSKDLKRKELPR
jgi:hypothetical protein